MPDSFGKRQRERAKAQKAAAKEERRAAKNQRRADIAAGILPPEPEDGARAEEVDSEHQAPDARPPGAEKDAEQV
jgi:hypothetical protein